MQSLCRVDMFFPSECIFRKVGSLLIPCKLPLLTASLSAIAIAFCLYSEAVLLFNLFLSKDISRYFTWSVNLYGWQKLNSSLDFDFKRIFAKCKACGIYLCCSVERNCFAFHQ